jgi:spermidine/putrescine transport system substrate-binding protein
MKTLFALLLVALLAPAHAAETLRLFIWSEYIDPEVVADFEKANDCKVVIDLYEDAESMLAKVQAASNRWRV